MRQGDLLSPFLFVLIIEVFNRMVSKEKKLGFIEGIHIGNMLWIFLTCNLLMIPSSSVQQSCNL